MSKKSTLKKVAIGAAVAGAAGYVAGILSAPRSGDKTRKIWKQAGGEQLDSLEEHLRMLYIELSELISSAKDELKQLDGRQRARFLSALNSAKRSKTKLAKVLDAVKSGTSDDRDLDKSVREAQQAIAHAKKFLLKK